LSVTVLLVDVVIIKGTVYVNSMWNLPWYLQYSVLCDVLGQATVSDCVWSGFRSELSFDIKNMYPSIARDDLVKILKFIRIENQLDDKTTNELLKITHTILEQNYFTFRNQRYSQNTGLAMGARSVAAAILTRSRIV